MGALSGWLVPAMTPIDPPMAICYECSRSTSGRCWRHRNVDLANFRPHLHPEPDEWRVVRFRLATRISDLEGVLAELVRLKDGPRDNAYRAAKDAAWDAARRALNGR